MAESKNYSGGIGVASLLGVAFVVLKLCNVIDWEWAWVLSPFWIPLAIVGAVLLFLAGCYGMVLLMTRK